MTYLCPMCQQPFSAYPSDERVTCSRTCGYRRQALQKLGMVPIAANAARVESQRRQSRVTVHQKFGELSVREILIIRAVYWRAYNLGYSRALKRVPREKAA